MRIAVIMLIHKYSEQQARLIRNLARDFDVYVHIDERTTVLPAEVSGERVFTYKKYKIYWGSFNQILATLFLFEQASIKGYDRYVFISGEDIPLRTNEEMRAFFAENNKEYFEFSALPRSVWGGNGGFDRIDFFHMNNYKRGKVNVVRRIFCGGLSEVNEKAAIPVVRKLGIRRRLKITYYGGTNWMDLTDRCVRQVVEFVKLNSKYLNSFKHTACADEIFFQTIICNYVKDVDLQNKSLRYVDWETGPETPRVLRMEDYGRLKGSDCLFARKFDSETDSEIIETLFKEIDYV